MPRWEQDDIFEFVLIIELTLGKVFNRGSHVERAKTPPSVCEDVNARKEKEKIINDYKNRLNDLFILPVWRATAPPLIITEKSGNIITLSTHMENPPII
jgi:hypothetical protein